MRNQVLWTLDNETDPKTFERLCVDLLYRNGYKNIVPVGGMHDRGRDAEALELSGIDDFGSITFFQFSQQKDWRQKLRVELRKVKSNEHKISKFVFVTTRDVSGKIKDQLKAKVQREFGWDLVVFSREWLRLQLEEAHPDLAYRHLGIQPALASYLFAGTFKFDRPDADALQKGWAFFAQGDYERSASEFRDHLEVNHASSTTWQVFSWCLYATFRYDEAIAAINKALELSPDSLQASSIRACILAERGISRGDKKSIKEANDIFAGLLEKRDDGIVHYNYGNTLSALARYEEAIEQYRLAILKEPVNPEIWKNLATAYHEVGLHDEEMRCLDRALELDPNLPQALISKGNSLMIDFDKPDEAIVFIERGISADRNLVLRWPTAWYWLGEAYRRTGNLGKGLDRVRQGLRQSPGDVHLRHLEFDMLSDLWRNGSMEEPLGYFTSLVSDEPRHYAARVEAVKILERMGSQDAAWDLLEAVWVTIDRQVRLRIRELGFSLSECCDALRYLPNYILHRRRYSVDDYVSSEFPAENNEWFRDAVFVSGAISFGLARHALASLDTHSGAEKGHEIESVFACLSSNIEQYVARACGELAIGLSRDDGVDLVSRRVAAIIAVAPFVVGEEWIRQYGWLLAAFDIDEAIQERIIARFSERDVLRSMVEPVLERVNEVAKIFPEGSED